MPDRNHIISQAFVSGLHDDLHDLLEHVQRSANNGLFSSMEIKIYAKQYGKRPTFEVRVAKIQEQFFYLDQQTCTVQCEGDTSD